MWALTGMMGGSTQMIAKSCLTAWREELATLRQERIVEKLKEELLQLKAKSDESTMRALAAMMGGNVTMIAKSCLTAWREANDIADACCDRDWRVRSTGGGGRQRTDTTPGIWTRRDE